MFIFICWKFFFIKPIGHELIFMTTFSQILIETVAFLKFITDLWLNMLLYIAYKIKIRFHQLLWNVLLFNIIIFLRKILPKKLLFSNFLKEIMTILYKTF